MVQMSTCPELVVPFMQHFSRLVQLGLLLEPLPRPQIVQVRVGGRKEKYRMKVACETMCAYVNVAGAAAGATATAADHAVRG